MIQKTPVHSITNAAFISIARTIRAPLTVRNHLVALRRLFREAAPAVFVEASHTTADDGRPHPVVDTAGLAMALPLTTKAQLRSFLHRYREALLATAQALPGAVASRTRAALQQLAAFAGADLNGGSSRRRRRGKAEEAQAAAASSGWVLQGAPTKLRGRRRDLWSRLVSPALEEQFKEMQRCVALIGSDRICVHNQLTDLMMARRHTSHTRSYRERSEDAIAATLQTLHRLFLQLPLEPYEEAALVSPFGTPEELRRFLRRHYFDMVDLGLEQERENTRSKGMGAEVEGALAELWLFVLVDRPDALEWMVRWRRHLEEVDETAAKEADRVVAEWEMIVARALGEVETGKERERVVGEMMAWARSVKATRAGEGPVGTSGVQAALGAAEGGPGGVNALEQMVEAVGELQKEEQGTWGKGFGVPNEANGAEPDKGNKRGSKRRYRRPWARGQNWGNGNGGS